MSKKTFLLMINLVLLFVSSISYAGGPASESAVLPKNVWRVRTYYQCSTATEKYNSNGDKIELVPDIEYKNSLSPLAAVLGANHVYGTITGDGKIAAAAGAFVVEYGFTDKLTGQVLIPVIYNQELTYGFGWQDNTADNATLATIGQAADPYGVGVLNAYKTAAPDQEGSGIGDIEIGAMYKFLTTEEYEAAVAGGARLATGKEDDPNNLKDFATGDGQYDLGLHFYGDWHINEIISLGGWAKYEPQLEATYDKAGGGTQKKNLGDVLKTLVVVYATPIEGLATKLGVETKFKTKDEVDGNSVADSNTTAYYLQPKVEYTQLKTKIPYRLTLKYDYPLAGKNTVVLATIQAGAQIFLKF